LKESNRILLQQEHEPKSRSRSLTIDNVDELRKALDAKTKSLENAKMLIASLENANGSMATDMRAKLREKDDRVHCLEIEAMERQRTLETLGKELRELRRLQGERDSMTDKVHAKLSNQKGLARNLENAISELQSAAVVHESTVGTGVPDESVIDQISGILSNLLMVMKVNLAAIENTEETESACTSIISGFSPATDVGELDTTELNRQLDAIIRNDREAAAHDLRSQLEEKTNALKSTEATFSELKTRIDQLRKENDSLKIARKDEEEKLNSEIQQLRDQCQTNLEVLTKKEQELQVLRDSLEVNDGVGYISGDESEGDDEGRLPIPRVESIDSPNYSATQTEALATLLVHSGSGVDQARNLTAAEAAKAKADLEIALMDKEKVSKELKCQREALANAKMIISSLEKANKTMLEDLRTRLQDSNTAIASLLDKTQESEKVSKELKEKLEKVEEEKQKMEEEHKTEIIKLKDGALVDALRLASKEKEIKELRTAGSNVSNSDEQDQVPEQELK